MAGGLARGIGLEDVPARSGDRPLRNTEHLGTDVDDTPAEFETEVERAATSNFDKHPS
jgi:hypothetical protein